MINRAQSSGDVSNNSAKLSQVIAIAAIFLCAASCSFGASKETPLGVENQTSKMLRGVSILADGEHSFTYGVLGPGQGKWYMNPPWPRPTRVVVSGSREGGKSFRVDLAIDVPPNFSGSILLVLQESTGAIQGSVQLEDD